MTYYLEEEGFEILFSEMKPIVMKLMKQIRIRTWKIEDYFTSSIRRAERWSKAAYKI